MLKLNFIRDWRDNRHINLWLWAIILVLPSMMISVCIWNSSDDSTVVSTIGAAAPIGQTNHTASSVIASSSKPPTICDKLTFYWAPYLPSKFRITKARLFGRTKKKRNKRKVYGKNCAVMNFFDNSFVLKMNNSRHLAIEQSKFMFDRVDEVFRETNFTTSGSAKHYHGYGHVVFDSRFDHFGWFDNPNSTWQRADIEQRLRQHLDDSDQFCLNILWTNKPTVDSEHGLMDGFAYGRSIFKRDYNFVVVNFNRCKSAKDFFCVRLFLHELGHPWGHDGHDQPEVSDGDYLMFPPINASFGLNNMKYSPRTITAIASTIEENESHFIADSIRCGNSIVEGEDEMCDEGQDIRLLRCCTPKCTLIPGAVCSPLNSDNCDSNCQFAAAVEPIQPNDDESLTTCIYIAMIVGAVIAFIAASFCCIRLSRKESQTIEVNRLMNVADIDMQEHVRTLSFRLVPESPLPSRKNSSSNLNAEYLGYVMVPNAGTEEDAPSPFSSSSTSVASDCYPPSSYSEISNSVSEDNTCY